MNLFIISKEKELLDTLEASMVLYGIYRYYRLFKRVKEFTESLKVG